VEEIGEELKEGLEFAFVESADEVFQLALTDSAGKVSTATKRTEAIP
jgi:ATP-dependent Lon protease